MQRRFPDGARKIVGWYLSPDAWNQHGDGHSLADQMMAVTRLGFEPASNDRIGGAMLLYSQLDRGDLIIATGCRQLCESLPTRIHDPGRPDDILKVHGDPLDDCLDALRYALYSYIGPARKPAAAGRTEVITAADPTVAMVQRRLAEERWQQSSRAARYLPRGRGR